MDEQQVLKAITAELVTAQDQLLALYELSNLMRRQTDLNEALQALVKLACLTLDAQQCVAKLEVPGRPAIMTPYPDSVGEAAQVDHWFGYEPGINRWTIRDGAYHRDSILLLPLWYEESNAGMLVCVRSNGKPFGSPDGKLGQALANQAAAFLENMILSEIQLENAAIRAELRVASEVQTSLLPKKLPCIDGLEIWGTSNPAKHVGGDFYDVQVRPDGTLFFYVGDVTGKGMPAALLMAMLLMILRSELRAGRYDSPAGILNHLNRAAYDELTASGMFATLFLASFDPKSRLLRYVNAGHSPVVIRSQGGTARILEANAVPVGVFDQMDAEEEELVLDIGDSLVVASDGLNESQNILGELFSIERMLELIDEVADSPAVAMGRELMSSVSQFSLGCPQSDDQTCLILKGVAYQ